MTALVQQQAEATTVAVACRAHELPRSTYYRRLKLTAEVEVALRDLIQQVALEWPAYGYRRITAELRRRGVAANRKCVLRLMREDNLLCLRKRRFIHTTNSDHRLPVYPNLVPEIVITKCGQLWISDITYIRLGRTSIGRMKVGLSSLSSHSLFDSQLQCLTFYRRKGGPSMSTTFVGLDLGSSRCQLIVLDADGTLRFSRVVPTGEQPLRAAFAALGLMSACISKPENSPHGRARFSPRSSPKSSFRIRAHSLGSPKTRTKPTRLMPANRADLLRLNLVHPVYCENADSRRTFNHLVTHYEQLSAEQARVKSKIKARLRTLGIIRRDARVFSPAGQDELLALLTEPAIKQMLTQSFAVLRQMLSSLAEAKQAMVASAAEFPEVRLLQTAPGVGVITACRFVAYVQTPRRFSNKRKLWRYARL